MSIYWMEKAVESLPDDKSQITFLFDRTGKKSLFNFYNLSLPCFLLSGKLKCPA